MPFGPRPNPSPTSAFDSGAFGKKFLPKSLNHRSARVRVPEPDLALSDSGAFRIELVASASVAMT